MSWTWELNSWTILLLGTSDSLEKIRFKRRPICTSHITAEFQSVSYTKLSYAYAYHIKCSACIVWITFVVLFFFSLFSFAISKLDSLSSHSLFEKSVQEKITFSVPQKKVTRLETICTLLKKMCCVISYHIYVSR